MHVSTIYTKHSIFIAAAVSTLFLLCAATPAHGEVLIIQSDGTWNTTGGESAECPGTIGEPGPDWTQPEFDDSGWMSSTAPWGYSGCQPPWPPTAMWRGSVSDPPLEAFFRKSFVLDAQPLSAVVEIYVDDNYQFYVNGTFVYRKKWVLPNVFDISPYLGPGENLIAIRAWDGDPQEGYCGIWEHICESIAFDITVILPNGAEPQSPLDEGGWELVAHMSDSGGMFDGNSQLAPDYTFGSFDPDPAPSTPDFQRVFPVVAEEILFITGDLWIWALTDYESLRLLIDAGNGEASENLAFEIGVYGVVSNTMGNVLSRSHCCPEDPWITMDGDHWAGRDNQRIVWGEVDWSDPRHAALKNNHGGINVYVRSSDAVDTDGDGVNDADDNCPDIYNPDQEAVCDDDELGDACDPDADNDLDPEGTDCDDCDPSVYHGATEICTDGVDNDCDGLVDLADTDGDCDGDEVLNADDNCPFDYNPYQEDLDEDGLGDVCDDDRDGDGILNDEDNCPDDANPGQEDHDGDGAGDVCDADADGDGLDDATEDLCLWTTTDPEAGVPSKSLGKNRWAEMDGNAQFDTSGKNPTGRMYTLYTTGGCNCAQIIAACGYGQGHTKFGCSNSVMDWWTGLYDREGEAPFQCKED